MVCHNPFRDDKENKQRGHFQASVVTCVGACVHACNNGVCAKPGATGFMGKRALSAMMQDKARRQLGLVYCIGHSINQQRTVPNSGKSGAPAAV
jgi:hypothetical protein